MKKRLAFLLVTGLMVTSLAACGSGNSTSTDGESRTAKTPESSERVLNLG